jgi:hypothetical protein
MKNMSQKLKNGHYYVETIYKLSMNIGTVHVYGYKFYTVY